MVVVAGMAEKKRRTYDLTDDVLETLDRLQDEGYAKEKVVNAGIRLFACAQPDLQRLALRGDVAGIARWFEIAAETWAVALVEKLNSTPEGGGRVRRGEKGKASGTG